MGEEDLDDDDDDDNDERESQTLENEVSPLEEQNDEELLPTCYKSARGSKHAIADRFTAALLTDNHLIDIVLQLAYFFTTEEFEDRRSGPV